MTYICILAVVPVDTSVTDTIKSYSLKILYHPYIFHGRLDS